MIVLLTCKNEKIRSKMKALEWSQHCKSFFTDAQGQITPELVLGSGRNLSSFKLSCMSSLPATMKIIQSKLKGLESSQHFSHYKSMGISPDAQGQLTPQSLVRSCPISISFEILCMFL